MTWTTSGTYEWDRPDNVRFILIRACGGGGGGGGGYSIFPHPAPRGDDGTAAGGGGGVGSSVATTLLGPLTAARYTIVVGRGGNGGASTNKKTQKAGARGEAGTATSFTGPDLSFETPGGEGGHAGTLQTRISTESNAVCLRRFESAEQQRRIRWRRFCTERRTWAAGSWRYRRPCKAIPAAAAGVSAKAATAAASMARAGMAASVPAAEVRDSCRTIATARPVGGAEMEASCCCRYRTLPVLFRFPASAAPCLSHGISPGETAKPSARCFGARSRCSVRR